MTFTPREIVSELDRYIIGQAKAKRAVSIALRNRWRRQQVESDLRDEISPKNIILMGPTGCGKTEIARRLAKLAKAPFVKVEASKFTEVGYVGRDVEGMIRDLVEVAMDMAQTVAKEDVQVRAEENAEERLVFLLANKLHPAAPPPPPPKQPFGNNPAQQLFGPFLTAQAAPQKHSEERLAEIRRGLRSGDYEEEEIEIDVRDNGNPFMTIFGSQGQEELNLKDMLNQMPGFAGKTKKRRVKVKDARPVIHDQEAGRLVDHDKVQQAALELAEQRGIVFLDEIDKVAARQSKAGGADVSREGVQRDLLPIVEGSTVSTKYGPVKTDHILFVAAGAFHVASVSDLIPELQGRFPIRVELESLGAEDFARILKEPKNALTKQYVALMATEQVTLTFEDSALEAIAQYAADANSRSENIGARRLHTVLEALLEELSFTASERRGEDVKIDAAFVRETLEPILGDSSLARFIL